MHELRHEVVLVFLKGIHLELKRVNFILNFLRLVNCECCNQVNDLVRLLYRIHEPVIHDELELRHFLSLLSNLVVLCERLAHHSNQHVK